MVVGAAGRNHHVHCRPVERVWAASSVTPQAGPIVAGLYSVIPPVKRRSRLQSLRRPSYGAGDRRESLRRAESQLYFCLAWKPSQNICLDIATTIKKMTGWQ